MFQSYLQLVKDLFNKVFSGNQGDVTFLNYMQVVGMGILLLLMMVVIIAGIIGLFFVPYKGYGVWVKNNDAKIQELLDNNQFDQFNILSKKRKKKSILFWLCFIVVYVPFAIPTVLYFIYLVTSIL